MAQLKDLLVSGVSRLTNNTYINGTLYLGTSSGFAVRDAGSGWIIGKGGTGTTEVSVGSASLAQPVALNTSKGNLTLDANGNVGIGVTTASYKLQVNGTGYFSGLLTLPARNSHSGIKLDTGYITAIDNQIILQNSILRFGGDNWDWNVWAGLKYDHSSKTVSIGIADGTIFNANSAQTGGKLQVANCSIVPNTNNSSSVGINDQYWNLMKTQWLHVNSAGSSNDGGITLYANGDTNYGIFFRGTGNMGTHGYVTADWATYFTMSNTDGRGWVFRTQGAGNVASIDTKGRLYTNERITSQYKSGTWVNSLTNSAFNIPDATGSYGGWICGPTKDGRITISTYQSSTNLLYFGYGERGRTTNSFAQQMTWDGVNNKLTAGSVAGAIWNDYAEYRKAEIIEPGRCVREDKSGEMKVTSERLMKGCEIISDTFGFAIGETEEYKTPIAAAGRVLAYTDKPRETFELGMPVCSGPDGTVSQMTEEEARMYPWCIIGTVSEIPTYETWGTGNVNVDGRIWIRIR